MTKTRAVSVDDNGLWVDCLGNKELLEYDALVIATGREPGNNNLTDMLKKTVTDVYVISDSVRPRGILEAIHEGFEVGGRI